jgi:hypothetical protein
MKSALNFYENHEEIAEFAERKNHNKNHETLTFLKNWDIEKYYELIIESMSLFYKQRYHEIPWIKGERRWVSFSSNKIMESIDNNSKLNEILILNHISNYMSGMGFKTCVDTAAFTGKYIITIEYPELPVAKIAKKKRRNWFYIQI